MQQLSKLLLLSSASSIWAADTYQFPVGQNPYQERKVVSDTVKSMAFREGGREGSPHDSQIQGFAMGPPVPGFSKSGGLGVGVPKFWRGV